jgi:integrase
MTNPCIYERDKTGHVLIDSEGKRVIDKVATKEYRNRGILTPQEIDSMLDKADTIENEYFRLRVRALIGLVKKFGKRRAEASELKRSDLKTEKGYLYVTFTLRKKHKLGLFQYLKFLKKKNPQGLNKPYPELVNEWQSWRQTEQGQRIKEEKRTKRVSKNDKYARLILEYLSYLERVFPETIWLFSSGHSVFGSYIIQPSKHLSGRQLLNLIKPLNRFAWLHLFRETKGAEIAKELGRNLRAVYEVRETLDLEKEETAYRYVRRYAVQEIKAEV